MDEDLFARLVRSLTNQTPNADQIARIEEVPSAGVTLGQRISEMCVNSRERSLAVTHLEETVMWAVKSIVLEP